MSRASSRIAETREAAPAVPGALLEAVLRHAGGGLAVFDAAGAAVCANAEAARLGGYSSAAELVSAPPGEALARLAGAGAERMPEPVYGDGGEILFEILFLRDRRAVRRTELQLATTRILADAETVAAAVSLVLEGMLAALEWEAASFWPADAGEPHQVRVRPEAGLEGFVAALERASLHAGMPAGRALRTGRAVWLDGIDGDAFEHAPIGVAEGVRFAVGFPVAVGTEVVGAIEAFARTAAPRDTELEASLTAIGAQLGQFIRRKRFEEERAGLLQREREARAEAEAAAATLRKLERVAEAALAHLSLQDLLHALLERIVEVLEADTGAILLIGPDGDLHVRASVGLDEELPRAVAIPVGAGMAGRVAADRQALLVPDLSRIELVSPVLRERGINSLAAIPLVVEDAVIGVCHVGSEAYAQFVEEDVRLLELIADRIALAINQAALYDEAQERAQAARVLASVGEGVFLVDRAGHVRTWNGAAASATGLAAERVIGRAAAEAILGWAAIVAHIPLVPVGELARPESLPLDLGDRALWISIHGLTLPDGIVYAFRDRTDERALETMRNEFVSTVSHELRTPLAAIYGAAMTLRRGDVALAEEQREKLLDVVSGEADRLARTVNDILWASRLDTDALTVSVQNCDALELAREVVEAQQTHLGERHELILAAAPDLPQLAADSDKVSRVLINLVDNAVKYSPDGGRVTVELGRSGACVRFSVADEGLGIPAAEQERVFEKFYRLDPNMNRGVGGTGLGLYICRELVRRMDGRIWVDSPGVGAGSTFHVELPAAGEY